LVELLVVIAIIGILIALLMPAVQAAREAGRRTQCRDNLHNIGIALHLYHDIQGTFPAGFETPINGFWKPSWSWSALVLPYLEQNSLHSDLGVTTGALFPLNPTRLTQMELSIFECPSDSDPTSLNHRKRNHGKSNYHGVLGNFSQYTASANVLRHQNGTFYADSTVSMGKIIDGTSNTLVVGEIKLVTTSSGKKAALWAGMRGIYGGGFQISDTMWWINGEDRWKINGTGEQAFSSNHPGGAQFVFADDSVHFLSENTDGKTLERLAARNDGEQPGDY